jgi:predicted acetyltransferase
LVELSGADISEIKEMYDRFYKQHHGMMKQSETEIAGLLKGDHIIVGFRKEGKLQGVLIFSFKRIGEETIYGTDLMIDEMIPLTPEAFQAFSTFIHGQTDQVREVLIETRDPLFSQYFYDPSSDDYTTFQTRHQELYRVGAGMMYRVISMEKILKILTAKDSHEPFPTLRIWLKDSLMPEQEGAYFVYQEKNKLTFSRQARPAAVEMEIDIADFSALVMGSTQLQSLIFSGKVTLSDHGCLSALESLLQTRQFPICLSRF